VRFHREVSHNWLTSFKENILMRILLFILLNFILSSCHSEKPITDSTQNIMTSDFSALNSDTEIEGSILIYNLNNNSYYSNDFELILRAIS